MATDTNTTLKRPPAMAWTGNAVPIPVYVAPEKAARAVVLEIHLPKDLGPPVVLLLPIDETLELINALLQSVVALKRGLRP
jgi:hypothetical protein